MTGSAVSFPLPPWEEQPEADNNSLAEAAYQQPTQTPQVGPVHGNIYPQGYQHMENGQARNEYIQATTQGDHTGEMSQPQIQSSRSMGIHPQQMQYARMAYMYPQQMYSNQMEAYAYGYGQFQNNQYLDQRISGLSINNDGDFNSSSSQPSQSYVPSGKPTKPEDKLFGDLVDIKKFKPTSSTHAKTESM